MRKYIIFAVVALGTLAGCSSEENIGVVARPEPVVTPDTSADAIVFSSMSKGVTRADHVGADAANLLSKHFWGFDLGFSLLIVNGLLTFLGMWMFSTKGAVVEK